MRTQSPIASNLRTVENDGKSGQVNITHEEWVGDFGWVLELRIAMARMVVVVRRSGAITDDCFYKH